MKNKLLKALRIYGILNGRKAFGPPQSVDILLGNKCNLNCVVCGSHSEFLREKPISNKEEQLEQNYEKIKQVIKELLDFGVEEFTFSAHGEPFLYPKIIDLIKIIKKKDKKCTIITNGTLIDENIIKKLSELKVDLLKLSLWAGDSETYSNIRPDKNKSIFNQIEKWLLLLKEIKKNNNLEYPKVLIRNVIFNKNYRNIKPMLEFAEKTNVNSIEFRLAHLWDKGLKIFCLSKNEKEELTLSLKNINPKDFSFKINLEEFKKTVNYNSKEGQRMDRDIPSKIPCYMGWFNARIDVNGLVRPCSNCFHKSMGNIHKNSFKEIWFSTKYDQFRKFAKQKIKGSYFKGWLCDEYCCQYTDNLKIYKKLNPLKKV